MPSLRMKKSSMCCLREKNCLRVCQKSNSIAKRSCSHLKISQIAADSDTCESDKDVTRCVEVNVHETGANEATDTEELLSHEDIQLKQLPASLGDSAIIEAMDVPMTTLETIFSPIMSHTDIRNLANSYDNAEINNDQDPFRLSITDESDGNSGSSSENHTCNISDFYISDMILAGLPFGGSSVCDDIAETLIFPAYDTAESNICFDVTERHMTLPFLDDSVESSTKVDVRISEQAEVDSDNSSFLLAIHQICPGDQEAVIGSYAESEEAQYFDPHSFIRNLPDLSEVLPNGQPTILPKESRQRKSVTLVLDLDETLVHSTLEHCDDADFTFKVFFNMKEHTVYVKERPHVRTFLKKVAEMFEVVVFTASQSIYAEQLLDILDTDGKLISGRAYRESCIFSDGSYTKDLTVLGLDLAKVVIIDNSPQVFRLQVNNGIPIKSWFDDPSDNELISLIPFLETLADAEDVRPLIATRFGNKE